MEMTETQFGKVINFEGINFSNLYYTVAVKYNEQSSETILVSWQIYHKNAEVSASRTELIVAYLCRGQQPTRICYYTLACMIFLSMCAGRIACKNVLLSHHGQLCYFLNAFF